MAQAAQDESLARKIKSTFMVFCARARREACRHGNAARRNESWKNFHSLSVILINLFTGSVLFASLKTQIPDVMKWAAATLALMAACCSAIQTYFKYAEKTDAHKTIANRFTGFIRDCEITVLDFEKGGMSVQNFQNILRAHKRHYDPITREASLLTNAAR